MVGVPGRSKACHNCRQRRIKCGAERPGCQNCAKSNRLCEGYQRNHAIILSKDMAGAHEDAAKDLVGSSAGSASINVHVGRWRIHTREKHSPLAATRAIHRTKDQLTQLTGIPVPIAPRHAFREQFFSLFLAYNFPTVCQPSAGTVKNNWMLEVLRLPSLSPALENATLALCAARIGRHDKQVSLVHQSLSLYTQGLHEFSKDVGRASSCQDEQTLAACMVMMMYEVLECPGGTPDGYQAHYNGTIRLLQMRGPQAHTTGLAHSVFQSLRVHSMYQSYISKSKGVLSEIEWRNIPFTGPKGFFDRLLDVLLDIPGLFFRLERMKKHVPPLEQFPVILEGIREALVIEDRLATWYTDFRQTITGPLYYPELSKREYKIDKGGSGKVFPVAYRFPALGVAQNIVFYWSALLSVHAHLGWMYKELAANLSMLEPIRAESLCRCGSECLVHFRMESLPPMGDRSEWPRTLAYDICQSIEYCLEDHGPEFSPASVMPALTIVKWHWIYWPGDWSREIAWVGEVLSRLEHEQVQIARFLQ